MPVIPINPEFSNIPDFVNSLFDPDVRTLDVLEDAIGAGRLTASFSDEVEKILSLWRAAWRMAQGDPHSTADYAHCPTRDRALFAELSRYLAANPLTMFVPIVDYVGLHADGRAIYELSGYDTVAFRKADAWEYSGVDRFLELFIHGAHFLVIHAPIDLPSGPPVGSLYKALKEDGLGPQIRMDFGDSHYTSTINLCSHYYPRILEQKAHAGDPFVLAFLFGPTDSDIGCAQATHNTFFQLEGWPNIVPEIGRHPVDYSKHEKTLWNISTYGACAYSEKRATAVFLAPPEWNHAVNPVTYMPPFSGAETRQHWLATQYVRLPAGLSAAAIYKDAGPGPA